MLPCPGQPTTWMLPYQYRKSDRSRGAVAEHYVGAEKAAEILGYTSRHVRGLRARGLFPAPEVGIEEAKSVRVGWRRTTIERLRRHLRDPAAHAFPRVTVAPARYLGMSVVAQRFGFTTSRGYQRAGADDFPPHTVELEQPGGVHKGWDATIVDEYAPRLNRAPGRPAKERRR
jgi:hypothetical protein